MGSCNSTTNCNPCGPDYNAINQLATQTAAYARQANTYSVDAQNAWLEFNALYLGAFASAPAVDNEGNPLQTGALYWNSVLNNLWVWNGTMWMLAVEGELYLGGFAVAPTLDNEGNPLQAGNLYWNTASNNLWAYNGSSWAITNFNETTPFLATGTTFARNLVTREADVVNVKDFGADPTGVVDSSTAFQNALNLLNSRQNGGTLFIPSGSYTVNNTLTFSNTSPTTIKSLTIVGEGEKITTITKKSGTDLFVFNGVKKTIAYECDTLHVKGITFIAGNNGVGVGAAIKAIWPKNMNASFCCTLENLHFRALNGNGASYWWDSCINLENASQSRIVNIVSNFVNSSQTTHIRLDYSNNPSSYAVLMDRLYLQGGLYGVHQTGCVEMVMISKGEIVGNRIGVFMDSSASLIPTSPVGYNPLLDVKDIHINSKEWNIKTINWEGINISGVEFYHGVGSGTDINGGNVYIENTTDPSASKGRHRIINNKFESPLNLPIIDIGLHLKGIGRAIVSGNLFLKNAFRNIFIENCNKIAIESNAFYPNFQIENSIRVENTVAPLTDPAKTRIIGNTFENALRAIYIENGASDCDILGNSFDDIQTPILLDNPRIYGQQIAIQGNKSAAWERKLLEVNSTTPSVSGAQEGLCYHANSSATTITDFVDGYASQTIDIQANNGNTTIQHNANILLQGAVNFVMSNGSRLYLRKEDFSSGSSWYETGRLT